MNEIESTLHQGHGIPDSMLDSFLRYISQNELVTAKEKTLLAVSGGVDSVVLTQLFAESQLPFGISHCNFQLRGKASDDDETFVKDLAATLSVPFCSTKFDTVAYAETNRLSIQTAARQLRYEWFDIMCRQQGFAKIATAHHLDDSIETALYNFIKGCGLRGLHGILPMQGMLIRPLLFATKHDILNFAKSRNLDFREDESNTEDNYARNKIRLHAIPVFRQINPSFERTASETIERLREVEALLDYSLKIIRNEVMVKKSKEWHIDLPKLLSYPSPATVLYELLTPFGFNRHQVQQILNSLDHQPGGQFWSKSYRLLQDRFLLIVSGKENSDGGLNFVDISLGINHLPDGIMTLQVLENVPESFSSDSNKACLDFGKLTFPLTLRKWEQGDRFCPLGMGGHHQKLQDFFSNRKLTRFEKEQVWLLESKGEICWIVGYGIDERFKVSGTTKRCLAATWESGNFAEK